MLTRNFADSFRAYLSSGPFPTIDNYVFLIGIDVNTFALRILLPFAPILSILNSNPSASEARSTSLEVFLKD